MGLLSYLLLGLTLLAENQHPAHIAGIYEGAIPVKGADARKLTLTLQQDGSAEFLDAGKKSKGQWTATDDEVRLVIPESPVPVVWKTKKNSLVPTSWEPTKYGKKAPILRRPR